MSIRPIADAFLRMIKMIIAPLLYFEVATTIALVIGLVLVNVFKPGIGVSLPAGQDAAAVSAMSHNQQSAWDIFPHVFPTSVVVAMARGDIL